MSPFYDRLPGVKMLGVDIDAQTIGIGAVGFVAVATAVHAGGVVARRAREKGRRAMVAPDGTVVPETTSEPAAPAQAGDGDQN
jgi:hypothetical protein